MVSLATKYFFPNRSLFQGKSHCSLHKQIATPYLLEEASLQVKAEAVTVTIKARPLTQPQHHVLFIWATYFYANDIEM